MKFRIARHTTALEPIIQFYTQCVGLEVLGSFEDHDNYNGVFLGLKSENWHLEFTVSEELPNHSPDKDDLLVFYPKNEPEYTQIVKQFSHQNITTVPPQNPYWEIHGSTYEDPDGFRVVIVKPQ